MVPSSIALLRQRPIPGGWTEQTVTWGSQACEILRPANADEFLEPLDSQPPSQVEPDIFWAQIWSSAWPMCELVTRANWPAGTTILELGCGVGLVGLAALTRGWKVTFSDYVPLAVELALANAARNGFLTAEGMILDWRHPQNAQFDVILGSDILYDQHHHEPLLNLLVQMLSPSGLAWIGDPGRCQASALIDLAWDRGFNVELHESCGASVPLPISSPFQLLELRRQVGGGEGA